MAKPNYEKPASQVDLEARQKSDYVSPSVLKQGVDAELSENGFINTDPIYQNFSEETHKPFQAEKGAEAKVEEKWVAEDADLDAGATPEGESDAEPEVDPDLTPDPSPTPNPFS